MEENINDKKAVPVSDKAFCSPKKINPGIVRNHHENLHLSRRSIHVFGAETSKVSRLNEVKKRTFIYTCTVKFKVGSLRGHLLQVSSFSGMVEFIQDNRI